MDHSPRRPFGSDIVKEAPWLLASEGEIEEAHRVVLDATEARHAGGPLRLKSGDRVVMTDGAGAVASGTLVLLRRGAAEVVIDAVDRLPRPAPGLTLAVAVLTGAAMDLAIQKAVELGVERMIPVGCKRSQISAKRAMTRMEHWIRVSRQALKQCHRAWAMELAPPIMLTDFVDDAEAHHGVVAHPTGGRIEELPSGRGGLLLIGPEGGFSPDEERELDAAGWPRVCLGPYVLRAETAAIAGAAVFSAGLHSTDG